jgi:hypothetical protein
MMDLTEMGLEKPYIKDGDDSHIYFGFPSGLTDDYHILDVINDLGKMTEDAVGQFISNGADSGVYDDLSVGGVYSFGEYLVKLSRSKFDARTVVQIIHNDSEIVISISSFKVGHLAKPYRDSILVELGGSDE